MSEVKRDRWDRPLIPPPDGGTPVPYQRASSYGDVLDDTYNLRRWEMRHVALGLLDRPDLLLKVAEKREDKEGLNKLTQQAKEAAGTSVSSGIGTTLHSLTERYDRGEPVPTLPDPYQGSIEAFQAATEPLDPVYIEQFVVCDHLQVAGTIDRLYSIDSLPGLVPGDTKTGQKLDYGIVKIAVQLAVYSRSVLFDPKTGVRDPVQINQDWAIIVHLPAGQETCELIWLDLNRGWELALLARDVRDSRKLGLKDLTQPVSFEDLI